MTVLKHLIHIFVILGCIGFLYTGTLLYFDRGTSVDKYEMTAMRQTVGLNEMMMQGQAPDEEENVNN